MRKLGALLLVIGMAAAVGCGDDEDDASTDFEKNCQKMCDAAEAAGCPIQGCSGAGCGYLEDQFGSCSGAYGSMLSCVADAPLECQNGLPIPANGACVEESLAFSECFQELPCRDFCASADAAGCGGETCVDRCMAEEQGSPFCSIEVEDLRECQTENGIVCSGGTPVPGEACSDHADQLLACVASDDPCAGDCMAAELAGCGGERQACVDACNLKLTDATCGSQYQQLVYCHGQNGVACNGTEPTSTPECTSQQESYETCAQ